MGYGKWIAKYPKSSPWILYFCKRWRLGSTSHTQWWHDNVIMIICNHHHIQYRYSQYLKKQHHHHHHHHHHDSDFLFLFKIQQAYDHHLDATSEQGSRCWVPFYFFPFDNWMTWLHEKDKWSRFVAGEFKPPKMGGKPVQQKIPDLRKKPLTCWNSANDQISVWTIRMLLPPNALKLSLSELLALKQKSWTLHSIYIYIQASIGVLYTSYGNTERNLVLLAWCSHWEDGHNVFLDSPKRRKKKYHSSPSPFLQTANVSFGIQTRIYTDTGCCSSLSVYVYEGLFKQK